MWLMALSSLLVIPLGILLPDGTIASEPLLRIAGGMTPGATALESRAGRHWLVLLWLSGVGLCFIRIIAGALRARQIVQRATVATGDSVDLRRTGELQGPVAWGFGRRLVLLPEDARNWPVERRRAVVFHETAHLERRDCWALLVAELACALYWFHPLVWYAASQMRRAQEMAADDQVLQSGVDAREYAEHLVALARSQRSQLLMAGAVTRSDLSARIEAILDSTRRREMPTRKMVAATIASVLMLMLPLAAMQTGRKIYKITDPGVTRPVVLEKEEPQYSEQARDAKIEGSVVLSTIVETDGRVYDVVVERGLEETLDNNAVAAVRNWIFKPAEKDGKPVAVAAKIEINFRLL
jgi:TonB family protein